MGQSRGMLIMAHKSSTSAGSKASKQASNAVLSASSSGKVQTRPDPASKPNAHGAAGSVSAEKRRIMIAEAAYYMSERRGFEAGREVEDWLLAERQVDAELSDEMAGARAA